jgi:protein TonB
MSLGIAARRFKRYPALARERGWEGRAEVALIFSVVLPLPEVVLTRSSGRTVLDEQAVEMMTQASRVTSLPEGLKGRDFRFSKAVEFSLENDQ